MHKEQSRGSHVWNFSTSTACYGTPKKKKSKSSPVIPGAAANSKLFLKLWSLLPFDNNHTYASASHNFINVLQISSWYNLHSRMEIKRGKLVFSDAKLKPIVWTVSLTLYICSSTVQNLHLHIKYTGWDSKLHYASCLCNWSPTVLH